MAQSKRIICLVAELGLTEFFMYGVPYDTSDDLNTFQD